MGLDVFGFKSWQDPLVLGRRVSQRSETDPGGHKELSFGNNPILFIVIHGHSLLLNPRIGWCWHRPLNKGDILESARRPFDAPAAI